MLKNQRFKIKPRTGHPRNSVFPGGDPPVPDQVTGVLITGTTSSSVSASWNSANNATSYNIYVNDSLHASGISSTNATISGLSSNTTYQISVAGQNSTGEGLRSSNMPATTQQIVSGTRNRLHHPYPADDPYNMPLGTNVVYAHPTNDPATKWIRASGGEFNVRNGFGWSHPLYFPTTADPWTTHKLDPNAMDYTRGARSYRPEEDGQKQIIERLPIDAIQAGFGGTGYYDGAIHTLIGNELVELFRWSRNATGSTNATCRKIVRNRLDHYSYGVGFVKQPDGSWVWLTFENDPLRNMASGGSAWGGSAIAGLIREAEIAGPNPHIPHALRLQARAIEDLAGYRQGDPSNPAYNYNFVFPATASDATSAMSPTGTYPDGRYGRWLADYPDGGATRMGMRFALDPSVVTDAWISQNCPNPVHVAVAKAMRDYGCLIADDGPSKNSIAAQEFMDPALVALLKVHDWPWYQWNYLRPHLRRVYAPGVQVPRQDHWRAWVNNGQGWGGGAPRVPYSPPLAPL
jgi:hypothetical protein